MTASELTPTEPAETVPALAVGRPALTKALAKAQQQVRGVEHDATNAYHHYQYTSAEAIIEAAKTGLASCGLAILPLEQSLDGWERVGENRFQLICRFVLLHESGESVPLVRYWPVCPEKGRPLDKATAAASTLCLAYLLRDLLLMPRVDPADDVPAREERPAASQPKKPPPRPAPPPAPPALPRDGAELRSRLQLKEMELVRKGWCGTGDLIRYVAQLIKDEGLGQEIVSLDPIHFNAVAELVGRWIKERTPQAEAQP